MLTENENLIFRGNTFATKAVDTYMKMVGDTVSPLVLCNNVYYLLLINFLVMVRDLITMGIAELVLSYCCNTLECLRTRIIVTINCDN